jgi:sugar phosphate isomerase/epimerase
MKRSFSNIAWSAEHDAEMYAFLHAQGFDGLEIAPTRIFPEHPYEHLDEARNFAARLYERYGFAISSMQSILYGRAENIFGSHTEREDLLEYTRKAVDFAAALSCGNLVFGCPKNRTMPEGADIQGAYDFFGNAAEYAEHRGTVIALEPNPPYYGTNFINTTQEAFDFCRKLNLPALKVNADLGTLISNGESINLLKENISLINHIHISEPKLAPIERREVHREICRLEFGGYVSVEMGNTGDLDVVKRTAEYIRGLR